MNLMRWKHALTAVTATFVAACGGGGGNDVGGAPAPIGFNPATSAQLAPASLDAAEPVAVGLPNGDALVIFAATNASGSRQVVSRRIAASGQVTNEGAISTISALDVRDLRLGLAPDGSAYAAFIQKEGTVERLMTRQYLNNDWQPVEDASHSALGTVLREPDLAFSTSGEPVLTWREISSPPVASRVVVAEHDASAPIATRWVVKPIVTASANQNELRDPRLVVLPGGDLLVAAHITGTGILTLFRSSNATDWTLDAVGGAGPLTPGLVKGFGLSKGQNGEVVLVWAWDQLDPPNRRGRTTVLASQLLPTKTWSAPMVVDQGAATAADNIEGLESRTPSVVVDAAGRALLSWVQETPSGDKLELFGTRIRVAEGVREAPWLIGSSIAIETRMRMVMKGPSNAVGVWTQIGEGNVLHVFGTRFDGSSNRFSPPERVDSGSRAVDERDEPALALLSNGRALAVWAQDQSGGQGLYFNVSQP